MSGNRKALSDPSHGRNTRYRVPPAQSRTCGIPASGSSVVLASRKALTTNTHPPIRTHHNTGFPK